MRETTPAGQLAPLSLASRIQPAHLARAAAAAAGTIGLAVLLGWALDLGALKSVLPGFVAMQPWTATAFALGALALWLAASPRRGARAASTAPALALAAVAGAPLLEQATGLDLGTDLLLFPEAVLSTRGHPFTEPGRMTPITALGLVAVAAALLLAPRVRRWPGRAAFSVLATAALSTAGVSLLGYVLGLEPLEAMLLGHAPAMHTALALGVLAAGTLALRPEVGWVGSVVELGRAGWVAAGLLGAAVLPLTYGAQAALRAGIEANDAARAALQLEKLLSTLGNAETGQRGYLLTGDESYLRPYLAARARLPGDLAALDMELPGGASAGLARIRTLADAKMAELAEIIALQRSGDIERALAVVETGRGQVIMDDLRATAGTLAHAKAAAAETAREQQLRAAALAGLGGFGLMGLAFWAVAATAHARRTAAERAVAAAEALGAAEARLRDLLATLDLATVLVCDPKGVIRFWSEGCVRLFGWTAAEAVGRAYYDLLHVISPVPLAEIEAALERDGEWTGELLNWTRQGQEIIVAARMVLRRDAEGRPAAVMKSVAEVTAQRRAEAALAKSEARLRAAQQAAEIGIFDDDIPGGQIFCDARARELWGLPEDRPITYAAIMDRVHPEDLPVFTAAITHALDPAGDGTLRAEYRVTSRADGRTRWVVSYGRVTFSADGRPLRFVGALLDITSRKEAEERQTLLAAEVDHRAKNALAVVQSIVSLTKAEDLKEFREAVTGRLAAMAHAQTLLAREQWEGADLRALAEKELTPYCNDNDPPGAERVRIEGPPVTLIAPAVQPLAMALHELATNAVKHGALSAPGGQLELIWSRDRKTGGLRLHWLERNGPRVGGPPSRRGFGTTVLERTVTRQLHGEAAFAWEPEGLRCDLMLPAALVRWSAQPTTLAEG